MSQVITNAFEQYWQSSLAAEQPVVLDEFILADIPNLDITSPIDPDAGLPPESQIVHRQNVDQRGRINTNAVAYSIVMDTTVGDFSFNAMYLRNKANGVIGMIVYKGRETKLKTDQTTGQTGNSLVKSMLMGYDQAAEATLTHVDAGTWQIDYAARLRGMDENIRQLQVDLYGHHTFVGDGFKVIEKDGAFQVTPGVAIVGGLRVELKHPEVIHPGTKPIGVWVDVHRAGSLLSEHQNHFTIITSVADLADHLDGNGYQHYVAKLAIVQADSSVVDGRGQGGSNGTGSIPDTFALWKRAMAEAGFDLIGQFGTANTLTSENHVMLSRDGSKVYSWQGAQQKYIEVDEDPLTNQLWVDVTGDVLRNVIKGNGGASFVGASSGLSVQEEIDLLKEPQFDIADVRRYGAKTSATDNSAAFMAAMTASPDVIVVSGSEFKLNSIAITTPISFVDGGAISVNTGHTVTFNSKVSADEYRIFRGAGDVAFANANVAGSEIGEEAREVHVAWWGIFPKGWGYAGNHAIGIQKVFDAVGNTREAVVNFDIGNYTMRSGCKVPRCCELLGKGTRRTVFLHYSDGFVTFTSDNDGVKLNGLQFEVKTDVIAKRVSPFVVLDHPLCEVFDVNMQNGENGIVINADNCRVKNINGFFGNGVVGVAADSALVKVHGSSNDVTDINANTSAFGPKSLVRVEAKTRNISANTIEKVKGITPSDSISVVANGFSISSTAIDGITYSGSTVEKQDSTVLLQTIGNGSINGLVLDGVTTNSNVDRVITVQQDSVGSIDRVSIDNVVSQGEGVGIDLIRTNGFINVKIGSGVNLHSKTTPFRYAGSSITAVIDPAAIAANVRAGIVYDLGNMATDTVATIPFNQDLFCAATTLVGGHTHFGQHVLRAAASPAITTIQQSTNVAATTGPLNGTSGVAGKLTISADVKKIYIENRTGIQQRVMLTVNYGA
ncbi:phage tail protein [Aeromonas sp. PS2Canimalfood6]|uniref:phage tail-collar fiber domain-containing protein n=1 Tax=Aeromonas sp. PS2Canimalfood6 TaxID=3397770 RepID=UPI003AA7D2BB